MYTAHLCKSIYYMPCPMKISEVNMNKVIKVSNVIPHFCVTNVYFKKKEKFHPSY